MLQRVNRMLPQQHAQKNMILQQQLKSLSSSVRATKVSHHDKQLFPCLFLGCSRGGDRGFSVMSNLIQHQKLVHGMKHPPRYRPGISSRKVPSHKNEHPHAKSEGEQGGIWSVSFEGSSSDQKGCPKRLPMSSSIEQGLL